MVFRLLSLLSLFLTLSACSSPFLAGYFNRTAAAPESRPEEILRALDLKPGMRVADLGAGGGYFALRFARLVGEGGRVYAVDINEEFLRIIEASARESGLANVRTVLSEKDETRLPEESVDLVFLRNVFHHLPDREAYFRRLRSKLKPGGRVAIIDFRKGGFFSLTRIFGHYAAEEAIVRTLEAAGYRLSARHDFLEDQSFTVFLPAGGN